MTKDTIEIIITASSENRSRYNAALACEDGSFIPLVSEDLTPFLSSARVLIGMGHDPDRTLAMRREGSPYIALRGNLGKAAKLRVRDDERVIRLEKYDDPATRLRRDGSPPVFQNAPAIPPQAA